MRSPSPGDHPLDRQASPGTVITTRPSQWSTGSRGRIYEQAAGRQQVSWGTVVVWEPAAWLVCEWLAGDTPTELEVRFPPGADDGMVVEIERRG